MALILNDRVRETTATTGTGALTLGGSSSGYQSFSVGIGNGNTTYYAFVDSASPPTFWEVGLGTYSGLTNTLSRDTVYSSSNGNALVNIPSGSVSFVYCDAPASQTLTFGKTLGVNGVTVAKDVNGNTTIGLTPVVIPFTASIAVQYTGTNQPIWIGVTNSTATWTITSSPGAPTAIAANLSDGTNNQTETTISGTSRVFLPTGLTISGTVTGNNSAGNSQIVNLSGTVPALQSYSPIINNFFGAQPTITTPVPAGNFIAKQFVSGDSFIVPVQATQQAYWLATPRSVAGTRSFNVVKGGFSYQATPDVSVTITVFSTNDYQLFGFNSFDATNLPVTVTVS